MPRDGATDGIGAEADEAPVGELFGRLIDDGKAYARAEAGLLRARAEAQADRAKRPAIFGAAAIAFAFAGVIALVLTLVLSLASLIGPLAGGLAATLLTFLIAGGLAWLAMKSWKSGK